MKQVDSIDSDLARYERECDNAFKKKCEDNAENILDELKESSNYYILKNIECQKKSNQNKGAAIPNE